MAAPRMAFAGIGFEPAAPARRVPKAAGRILAAIAAAALCAACQREAQAPPAPARPVRTVTVELSRAAPSTSFAGQIEARDEVSLGFRIAGRVLERTVGVGAQVRQGQVVAQARFRERAERACAPRVPRWRPRRASCGRQKASTSGQAHLLARGVTSQADFDAAEQARTVARSQVDAAEAQLKISQDVVGFTTLYADAPGVVTAIGAEPGEVVQAGRMIVQLARRDGRDAVFEVPENVLRDSVPDAPHHRDAQRRPGSHRQGARARGLAAGRPCHPDIPRQGWAHQSGRGVPARRCRHRHRSGPRISAKSPSPHPRIVGTRRGDRGLGRRSQDQDGHRCASCRFCARIPPTPSSARGSRLGDIVVTAGVSQLREGQPVRLIGVES